MTEADKMAKKTSLHEMDVLKGIAIIFVVVVHLHPLLINYKVKNTILSFHSFMYIFMFVSGFFYGFSGTVISSWDHYRLFVIKKFKRLMIPYFVVSFIVLILKVFASRFVVLVKPADYNFWKYILFNPAGGYAAFLWFLYVLFIIFMIFPLMNYFVKNAYVLFLMIFLIYFLPVSNNFYFNLDYVKFYLLFFYIGYIYSHAQFGKINVYSKYWCPLFFALFILCYLNNRQFIIYFNQVIPFMNGKDIVNLMLGVLGIFSFYYLSVLISNNKKHIYRSLNFIGLYSPAIYLFHTIFMSPAKILMIEYLHFGANMYPLVSVVSIMSGLIFPVLITRYFIRRYEMLSLMILGEQKYT